MDLIWRRERRRGREGGREGGRREGGREGGGEGGGGRGGGREGGREGEREIRHSVPPSIRYSPIHTLATVAMWFTYQREEVDNEVGFPAESEEGSAAKVLVCLKHGSLFAPHHVHKVRGQNKGGPLSLKNPEKFLILKCKIFQNFLLQAYHIVLDVPKEVSKVDVEEVSRGGDHDVVIVTVSYAL